MPGAAASAIPPKPPGLAPAPADPPAPAGAALPDDPPAPLVPPAPADPADPATLDGAEAVGAGDATAGAGAPSPRDGAVLLGPTGGIGRAGGVNSGVLGRSGARAALPDETGAPMKSSMLAVVPPIVITPPQIEQRARAPLSGTFAGSMRKTERHSGQATFTSPP